MLVDSHCHLDDEQFAGDLEAVLDRARESGVERMVAIGTGNGPAEMDCAMRIAQRYAQIYATVGIHPQYAALATPKSFDDLRHLGRDPKVVAFGEIGLDYHYDPAAKPVQMEVFTEQLKLARELDLPIVIHTRDAWDDTMAVLRTQWNGPCIIHCFTGNSVQAKEALDLGFHLALGGVLTYRTADALREAALTIPDDRMLVETDAPYLAPVPSRGKRNEPAFMTETVRKLAAIRNTTVDHIAAVTTANFERLCLRPRNGNRYTEVSNGD